ncbi:MAG: hypothetical protein ACTSR3_05840 [Candidatus Helarchaeota archaeon]
MKLKTLRDLKIPKLKVKFLDKNKLCSRVELKQEAIKWIKACKNRNLTNKEYQQGQIDWIKNFFNLEKEQEEK